MRFMLAVSAASLFAAAAHGTTLFGPTPYLSSADSPLLGSLGLAIEDFEDGLFNLSGVTSDVGVPYGPGGITDSVDADDGVIDGSGNAGFSFFSANGGVGITFTFDEVVLGSLPTRAGIVWTDGNNNIRFEAFDRSGVSLGVLNGSHADGSYGGTTSDDRFYGVEHASGIGSFRILSTGGGGIEVDHVQYGWIPTPSTLALLGIGGMLASRRRRD